MDNGQNGLLMKGAGPNWQEHILHQGTIVDDGVMLHVLNDHYSNADKLCFW